MAVSDHDRRMNRFRDYYQRWRVRYDPQSSEDKDAPNFRIPLVKWHVTAKLAKEVEALFGDDAEIVARPVGPSDMKRAKKVSLYMTWRLFQSMKIVKPFITFALRKILFGRSVAYAPWRRDTFEIPVQGRLQQLIQALTFGRLGGKGKTEVVDYEGPAFEPLEPDDFIVPAEQVDSLHDFTYLFRRYIETASGFFKGLDSIYQDNTGDDTLKQRILHEAMDGTRDSENVQVKDENDLGEAVQKRDAESIREGFTVWEWYGKWRPLKSGEEDADENDLSRREEEEVEYVARFQPDINRLIGLQRLDELYPLQKKRRPFVEAAMPGDGYWPPGFGELLSEIESEATAIHNLGVEAGQYSVGPLVFYRPGSGSDPQRRKYEPFEMIPVDTPGQDVNVVSMGADLRFVESEIQFLMGLGERLGVGDLNLGRTQDRPNAPRTVGQTVALLDESNVRFALDNRVFREDFADMCKHFWELEIQFLPARQFFRVTEEKAEGLFPVRDGAARLDLEDRSGSMDFDIRLATSAVNKEVGRQRSLEMFSLMLQNPLVAMNPNALWKVTNDLWESMGRHDFRDIVAEPPEPDRSKSPQEELVAAMQGDQIHVNPLDNDQEHIQGHQDDMQWLASQPDPDQRTMQMLAPHIQEHIVQMQQKALMEALVRRTAENVQGMVNQGVSPTELMGSEAAPDQQRPGSSGGDRPPSRQRGMGAPPGKNSKGSRPSA